MEYRVTDLEIETICSRIKRKDIDIQPEFQRGSVWSYKQRQKLIDTILREWQIPPIHLIQSENACDEVLDGKQRLESIFLFYNNKIKIDGNISPTDDNITKLDGLLFCELENLIQRKFNSYSIRIIRLFNFKPEEPAELFFRLNQPVTLTSAEKRNAFIGEARNQVKELVRWCENNGIDETTIGFSNSRMAYDDIIAKFCFTIETGTLRKKITSNDISEKYKSGESFSLKTIKRAHTPIQLFMESIYFGNRFGRVKIQLNKATLFSWLIYTLRHNRNSDVENLSAALYGFENMRASLKGKTITSDENKKILYSNQYPFIDSMFLIFNQRASMGSTDSLSIIMRDIIIVVYNEMLTGLNDNQSVLLELKELYSKNPNLPQCLEEIANNREWGQL